jgi:putative DNA primase/helicase
MLPRALLGLIRDGVENEEDRSAKFFSVVAHLKNRFWRLNDIVSLFEKYPHGITKKYAGRVAKETKRVFDKVAEGRDKLPIITLRKGTLTRIVNESAAALHKAGVPVFERSGLLVYPHNEVFDAGEDFHTKKPRTTVVTTLARYSPEALLLDVDRSARFIEWKKVEGTLEPCAADPPGNIGRMVMNNARHWQVRPIVGVIMAPLLRQDGSIIGGNKPLYDAQSRLYYVPGVEVPAIPDNPSKEKAASALKWLSDNLLSEFPFASTLDHAVALSGLMTPLVRASMDVAPMHMFRANTAGSGKSYLVETASMIAIGEIPAVVTVPNDTAELEKRLGALIMRGVQIINLDNASIDVGGDTLCQIGVRHG